MEGYRFVASQRRVLVIWIGAMLFLGLTMVISTVLRLLVTPITTTRDYVLIVGLLIGGSLGMMITLAILKTERNA